MEMKQSLFTCKSAHQLLAIPPAKAKKFSAITYGKGVLNLSKLFFNANNLSCSTAYCRKSLAVMCLQSGSSEREDDVEQNPRKEYCIINFYHLVDVQKPEQVVEEHRAWLQNREVRGRIYISAQGINAQFGGEKNDAVAYADWVAEQPTFQGLRYAMWPAEGHMYPKLRLKYKPNLISLAGGMSVLPVTDPAQRATHLGPDEWKSMILEAKEVNAKVAAGELDPSKRRVILDIRNDYEWDAGHFVESERPEEEEFNQTPIGEGDEDIPRPLRTIDKDEPVLMYCTGGIRCDVYSTFLRKKGYNNLYTLDLGIQNYLKEKGSDIWNGSLFVFDGRMAWRPEGEEAPLVAAVPCALCGSGAPELPHVNCANIDCNELFVACRACKTRLDGCCCEACKAAPRLLRPAKMEGGHYGQWGNYVDVNEGGPSMATGRTREGRLARRTRRREAMKERHMATTAEKLQRKQMVREAMAKLEAFELDSQTAQSEGEKADEIRLPALAGSGVLS